MKSDYPPISGSPRRRKEAPSDAGMRLSRVQGPEAKRRSTKPRRRPDRRLKVTVKDRELLEEMAEYFRISMSAVLNMGLLALAEKHDFR